MMGSYRYESPNAERKTISRKSVCQIPNFNSGSDDYTQISGITPGFYRNSLKTTNQSLANAPDPMRDKFRRISCSAPTVEKAGVIAYDIKRHIIETKEQVKRSPNFVRRTHTKITYLHNYNCRVAQICSMYPLEDNMRQLLVKYIELEMSILKNPEYNTEVYRLTVEMRLLTLLSTIYSKYCFYTKGRFNPNYTWQLVLELFEDVSYDVHTFFEDIRQKVKKKINPDPELPRSDPTSVKSQLTCYKVLDGNVKVEMDENNDPLLKCCKTFNIFPERDETPGELAMASGLVHFPASRLPLEGGEVILSDDELTDTGQPQEDNIKQEYHNMFLPSLTERLKALKRNAVLTEDRKPVIIDLSDDNQQYSRQKTKSQTSKVITKTNLRRNTTIVLSDSSDVEEDLRDDVIVEDSSAFSRKCDKPIDSFINLSGDSYENVISRVSRTVREEFSDVLTNDGGRSEGDNSTCQSQDETEILRHIRELKLLSGSSELTIKMVNNKLVITPKDNLNPSDVNKPSEIQGVSTDTTPVIQSSHKPVQPEPVNKDTVDLCIESLPHQPVEVLDKDVGLSNSEEIHTSHPNSIIETSPSIEPNVISKHNDPRCEIAETVIIYKSSLDSNSSWVSSDSFKSIYETEYEQLQNIITTTNSIQQQTAEYGKATDAILSFQATGQKEFEGSLKGYAEKDMKSTQTFQAVESSPPNTLKPVEDTSGHNVDKNVKAVFPETVWNICQNEPEVANSSVEKNTKENLHINDTSIEELHQPTIDTTKNIGTVFEKEIPSNDVKHARKSPIDLESKRGDLDEFILLEDDEEEEDATIDKERLLKEESDKSLESEDNFALSYKSDDQNETCVEPNIEELSEKDATEGHTDSPCQSPGDIVTKYTKMGPVYVKTLEKVKEYLVKIIDEREEPAEDISVVPETKMKNAENIPEVDPKNVNTEKPTEKDVGRTFEALDLQNVEGMSQNDQSNQHIRIYSEEESSDNDKETETISNKDVGTVFESASSLKINESITGRKEVREISKDVIQTKEETQEEFKISDDTTYTQKNVQHNLNQGLQHEDLKISPDKISVEEETIFTTEQTEIVPSSLQAIEEETDLIPATTDCHQVIPTESFQTQESVKRLSDTVEVNKVSKSIHDICEDLDVCLETLQIKETMETSVDVAGPEKADGQRTQSREHVCSKEITYRTTNNDLPKIDQAKQKKMETTNHKKNDELPQNNQVPKDDREIDSKNVPVEQKENEIDTLTATTTNLLTSESLKDHLKQVHIEDYKNQEVNENIKLLDQHTKINLTDVQSDEKVRKSLESGLKVTADSTGLRNIKELPQNEQKEANVRDEVNKSGVNTTNPEELSYNQHLTIDVGTETNICDPEHVTVEAVDFVSSIGNVNNTKENCQIDEGTGELRGSSSDTQTSVGSSNKIKYLTESLENTLDGQKNEEICEDSPMYLEEYLVDNTVEISTYEYYEECSEEFVNSDKSKIHADAEINVDKENIPRNNNPLIEGNAAIELIVDQENQNFIEQQSEKTNNDFDTDPVINEMKDASDPEPVIPNSTCTAKVDDQENHNTELLKQKNDNLEGVGENEQNIELVLNIDTKEQKMLSLDNPPENEEDEIEQRNLCIFDSDKETQQEEITNISPIFPEKRTENARPIQGVRSPVSSDSTVDKFVKVKTKTELEITNFTGEDEGSVIEEVVEYIISNIERCKDIISDQRDSQIVKALQPLNETSGEETVVKRNDLTEDLKITEPQKLCVSLFVETQECDVLSKSSTQDKVDARESVKVETASVPNSSIAIDDITINTSASASEEPSHQHNVCLETMPADAKQSSDEKSKQGLEVPNEFRNIKEDEYLLYIPEPLMLTVEQQRILRSEETKARDDPSQLLNALKNTTDSDGDGVLNLTKDKNKKGGCQSDLQPLNLATNNNDGEKKPDKAFFDQSTSVVTQQRDVLQNSEVVENTQQKNNGSQDRDNSNDVNRVELKPSDIPSAERFASYLPKNGEKMENFNLVLYNADEDPLQDLRESLSKFGTDVIPKTNNQPLHMLAEAAAIQRQFITSDSADQGSDSEGLLLIDEDSCIPHEYPEMRTEIIIGPSEGHLGSSTFVLQVQKNYQKLLGKTEPTRRKKTPRSLKNSITLYKGDNNISLPVRNNVCEIPDKVQTELLHIQDYQDINAKPASRKPNILKRKPKNNVVNSKKRSYMQPRLVVLSDESNVQRTKTKAEKKQMPTFEPSNNLFSDSDDDIPLAERVKSRTPSPKKAKSRYGTTDIVVGRQRKNEINTIEEKEALKRTRGKSGDRLKAVHANVPFVDELKSFKSRNLHREQEVTTEKPMGKRTRRKSGEIHKDSEKPKRVSKSRRKSGENVDIAAVCSGLSIHAREELEKPYHLKLRSRSCSGSDFIMDNSSPPSLDSVSQIIEPIGMCVEVKSTDIDSKELPKHLQSLERVRRRSGAVIDEPLDSTIVVDNDLISDRIMAVPNVPKLRRKSTQEPRTELSNLFDSVSVNIENESKNSKKVSVGLSRGRGRRATKASNDTEVLPTVKAAVGRGRGRGRGRKSIKTINNVGSQEDKPSKSKKTKNVKKDHVDIPLIDVHSITEKVKSTLEAQKPVKKPNLKLELIHTTEESVPKSVLTANPPTEVKENVQNPLSSPPTSATTPKERYKREFKAQIENAKPDVSTKSLESGLIQAVKELSIDDTSKTGLPIPENAAVKSPKETPEVTDVKVVHPKLRGKSRSLFSNCKNTIEPTATKLFFKLLNKTGPASEKLIKNVKLYEENIEDNKFAEGLNFEESAGDEPILQPTETNIEESDVAQGTQERMQEATPKITDQSNKEYDSLVNLNLENESVKQLTKNYSILAAENIIKENTSAVEKTESLEVCEDTSVELKILKNKSVEKNMPLSKADKSISPSQPEFVGTKNYVEETTVKDEDRLQPVKLRLTEISDQENDPYLEDSMLDDIPLSKLKYISNTEKAYENFDTKCIFVPTETSRHLDCVDSKPNRKKCVEEKIKDDLKLEDQNMSRADPILEKLVEEEQQATSVKALTANDVQPVVFPDLQNVDTLGQTSSLNQKLEHQQDEIIEDVPTTETRSSTVSLPNLQNLDAVQRRSLEQNKKEQQKETPVIDFLPNDVQPQSIPSAVVEASSLDEELKYKSKKVTQKDKLANDGQSVTFTDSKMVKIVSKSSSLVQKLDDEQKESTTRDVLTNKDQSALLSGQENLEVALKPFMEHGKEKQHQETPIKGFSTNDMPSITFLDSKDALGQTSATDQNLEETVARDVLENANQSILLSDQQNNLKVTQKPLEKNKKETPIKVSLIKDKQPSVLPDTQDFETTSKSYSLDQKLDVQQKETSIKNISPNDKSESSDQQNLEIIDDHSLEPNEEKQQETHTKNFATNYVQSVAIPDAQDFKVVSQTSFSDQKLENQLKEAIGEDDLTNENKSVSLDQQKSEDIQKHRLEQSKKKEQQETSIKAFLTNDVQPVVVPDPQNVKTLSQTSSLNHTLEHQQEEIIVQDVPTTENQPVSFALEQNNQEEQNETPITDFSANDIRPKVVAHQQNIETVIETSSSDQELEYKQKEIIAGNVSMDEDPCAMFLNNQNVEIIHESSFEPKNENQAVKAIAAIDDRSGTFLNKQNIETAVPALFCTENLEHKQKEPSVEVVLTNDNHMPTFSSQEVVKTCNETSVFAENLEPKKHAVYVEVVDQERDKTFSQRFPLDEKEDEQKEKNMISPSIDEQSTKGIVQTSVESQVKDDTQEVIPLEAVPTSNYQYSTSSNHQDTTMNIATTTDNQFAIISESRKVLVEECSSNKTNDSNDSDFFSFAQEAAKHACENFEEQGTYFDDSGSVVKHDLNISIGSEVEIIDSLTVDKEKEKLEIQDKLLHLLQDNAKNDVASDEQKNKLRDDDRVASALFENRSQETPTNKLSDKSVSIKKKDLSDPKELFLREKSSKYVKRLSENPNTTLGDSDSEVEIKKKYLDKSKKKERHRKQEDPKKTDYEKNKTIAEAEKKSLSKEKYQYKDLKEDTYRHERRSSWQNRSEERDGKSGSKRDRSESVSSINSGSSSSNLSVGRDKDRYKDKDRTRYSRSATIFPDKYKDYDKGSSDNRRNDRYDKNKDNKDRKRVRSRDRRYKDTENKLNKYEKHRYDENSSKEKDKYKLDKSRREVKNYSKNDKKRDRSKEDNLKDKSPSKAVDDKKTEKKEYKDHKSEFKSKSTKTGLTVAEKSFKEDRNKSKQSKNNSKSIEQKDFDKNRRETRQNTKISSDKKLSCKEGLFIMLDRKSIFQNISEISTDHKNLKIYSTVQNVTPKISEKGKETKKSQEVKTVERDDKHKKLSEGKQDQYNKKTTPKQTEFKDNKSCFSSRNKDENKDDPKNDKVEDVVLIKNIKISENKIPGPSGISAEVPFNKPKHGNIHQSAEDVQNPKGIKDNTTKNMEFSIKKRKLVENPDQSVDYIDTTPVEPKKKRKIERSKSQKSLMDEFVHSLNDVEQKSGITDPSVLPIEKESAKSTVKTPSNIIKEIIEDFSEETDTDENVKEPACVTENNVKYIHTDIDQENPKYSISIVQELPEIEKTDKIVGQKEDKIMANVPPKTPEENTILVKEGNTKTNLDVKEDSWECLGRKAEIKFTLVEDPLQKAESADTLQLPSAAVKENYLESTFLGKDKASNTVLQSSTTDDIIIKQSSSQEISNEPSKVIPKTSLEQEIATLNKQEHMAVLKSQVDKDTPIQDKSKLGCSDFKIDKERSNTSATFDNVLVIDEQTTQECANEEILDNYLIDPLKVISSQQPALKPSQSPTEDACKSTLANISEELPELIKQQIHNTCIPEFKQSINVAAPQSEPNLSFEERGIETHVCLSTEGPDELRKAHSQILSNVSEKFPATISQEPPASNQSIIEDCFTGRKQKRGGDKEFSEQVAPLAKKRPDSFQETVQFPAVSLKPAEVHNARENSPVSLKLKEAQEPKEGSKVDSSLARSSCPESLRTVFKVDTKLDKQSSDVLANLELKEDVPFFELSLVTDITSTLTRHKNSGSFDVPLIKQDTLKVANLSTRSSNKPLSDIQQKHVFKTSQQIINETFAQFLGSSEKISEASCLSSDNPGKINFENAESNSDIEKPVVVSQVFTESVSSEPKMKIPTQLEQNSESMDFQSCSNRGQDLYEQAPNFFRNPSPPVSTDISSIPSLDFRNPSPPSLDCLPVLETRNKGIGLDPYSIGSDTQRPQILPDFVENKDAANSLLGETNGVSQSNGVHTLPFAPTTIASTVVNFEQIYGNNFQNNIVTSSINSQYSPGKHVYQNSDLSKLVASSPQTFYNQTMISTSSRSIAVPSTSRKVLTDNTHCVQTLPDYMRGLKEDTFCEAKSEKASEFPRGERHSDILPPDVKFLEEYPCASPEQVLPSFNRSETFKASPATSSVSQHSENTRDTVDVNTVSSTFHRGDHTYPKDVLMNWHNEDKNELNQNPTGEYVKPITEYEMDELDFDLSLIDESSTPASGIFRHSSSIPTDGVWPFGVEPDNPNKILSSWDETSKVVVEPQPYYPDFSALNNSLASDITELSQGSESSDLDKSNIDLTEWFNLSNIPEILPDEMRIEKSDSHDPATKENAGLVAAVKRVKVPKAKGKKKPQLYIPTRQHGRTKVSAPKNEKEAPVVNKIASILPSVLETSKKLEESSNDAKVAENKQLPELSPLSGVTTRSASKRDTRDNYVTPQSQSMHNLRTKSIKDSENEVTKDSGYNISAPNKTLVITNGLPGGTFTVNSLLLKTNASQPKTNTISAHINSHSPGANLVSSKELVHDSPPKECSQQAKVSTMTPVIELQPADPLKQKQVTFSKQDVKGKTVRLQVVNPTFLQYMNASVNNTLDSKINAPPLIVLQPENHSKSPLNEPVEANQHPESGKDAINTAVNKDTSIADSSKKSPIPKPDSKPVNKKPSNIATPENSLLFESKKSPIPKPDSKPVNKKPSNIATPENSLLFESKKSPIPKSDSKPVNEKPSNIATPENSLLFESKKSPIPKPDSKPVNKKPSNIATPENSLLFESKKSPIPKPDSKPVNKKPSNIATPENSLLFESKKSPIPKPDSKPVNKKPSNIATPENSLLFETRTMTRKVKEAISRSLKRPSVEERAVDAKKPCGITSLSDAFDNLVKSPINSSFKFKHEPKLSNRDIQRRDPRAHQSRSDSGSHQHNLREAPPPGGAQYGHGRDLRGDTEKRQSQHFDRSRSASRWRSSSPGFAGRDRDKRSSKYTPPDLRSKSDVYRSNESVVTSPSESLFPELPHKAGSSSSTTLHSDGSQNQHEWRELMTPKVDPEWMLLPTQSLFHASGPNSK